MYPRSIQAVVAVAAVAVAVAVARRARVALVCALGCAIGIGLIAAAAAAPALAAEACPNEQVRAESDTNPVTGQAYSLQLPDCRAYELVSPADTGGWEVPAAHTVAGQGGPPAVVASENAVFFESQTQAPETGALENGDYLRVFRSHRTPAGWVTRALMPTSAPGNEMLWGAAATGSRALVNTTIGFSPLDIDNPTNSTAEIGQDLYVAEEGREPLFVTHGVQASSESPISGNQEAVANGDLTAVGFYSHTSLALPAVEGESTSGCYIWDDSGSRFASLVSPPALSCALFAVSASGRAIVRVGTKFYASDFGRTEQDLQDAVQLTGEAPAEYDGSSPDGETVYLSTEEHLTPGADADMGKDIYAIDLRLAQPAQGVPTPPVVTCVSCEADGSPNGASAVYAGQSADGSHVFFSIGGSLYVRAANATKQIAPAAEDIEDPVFSYDGSYTVASTSMALSPEDTDATADLYRFDEDGNPQLVTPGNASRIYRPKAVSDSGERVVYESEEAGKPSIYEWSSGAQAPISPLGATSGYAVLGTAGPELENVFFEAHDPLVSADQNAGATDIYDARVDGGFPAPVQTPSDSTTSNPTPAAIPAYTSNLSPTVEALPALPANSAISAPTRSESKRCPRGLVKRAGKCVRPKTRRTAQRTKKAAKSRDGARRGRRK